MPHRMCAVVDMTAVNESGDGVADGHLEEDNFMSEGGNVI